VPDLRVIVPTPTFARSRAFYVDMIGAGIVEEWSADEVQPAGAILRLTTGGCVELVENRMAHDGLRLGIEVDTPAEIDAIHYRLEAANVVIVSAPTDQPWGHRNCTVVAPEGTMLTFYAHLKP
jgi:catechol 2,3-dioxygenase-like lactoylglutathione lyase family enzyme